MMKGLMMDMPLLLPHVIEHDYLINHAEDRMLCVEALTLRQTYKDYPVKQEGQTL